jgi:chromosome segregation ATPase
MVEPGSRHRGHSFAVMSFGYTVDVRALNRARSRIVPLSIGLLLCAGSLAGCHRKSSQVAEVRQSLDALKPQFAELKKRFMDLRERVESIPQDVPGFGEARARFYAVEEARGVIDAKMGWLSSQLDAASSSGNSDQLQQVSKDIATTQDDIHKIDEIHTKILHEMMGFQRMAEREAAADTAAASPPAAGPPPASSPKTKRSKSNR